MRTTKQRFGKGWHLFKTNKKRLLSWHVLSERSLEQWNLLISRGGNRRGSGMRRSFMTVCSKPGLELALLILLSHLLHCPTALILVLPESKWQFPTYSHLLNSNILAIYWGHRCLGGEGELDSPPVSENPCLSFLKPPQSRFFSSPGTFANNSQ